MKTLMKILFFWACIGLVVTCSKSDDIFDEMSDVELKSGKTHTVTVPFKATFTGEYVNQLFPGDEGYDCDDYELPYFCHVFVDFVGTGTHLGKFTGNFEFCACGPEDTNLPSPNWQYAPTESHMVAANGDILIVSCSGSVIEGRADDHPEHVISYWRDKFVILGGTGRFEGATGGGVTDDYNSSLDPNSHHNWTGTITLVKGKRK